MHPCSCFPNLSFCLDLCPGTGGFAPTSVLQRVWPAWPFPPGQICYIIFIFPDLFVHLDFRPPQSPGTPSFGFSWLDFLCRHTGPSEAEMLGILRVAPVHRRPLDYGIMLLIAGVSFLNGSEMISFADCSSPSSRCWCFSEFCPRPSFPIPYGCHGQCPSYHLHVPVHTNPFHAHVCSPDPSPELQNCRCLTFRETLKCLAIVGAWGRIVSPLFGVGQHESINKFTMNYQSTILVRHFSVDSPK